MRKFILAAIVGLYTAAAGATGLFDIVTKGSTDRSVTVDIADSTDGTPENGVVFNTSGIDLWYRREGAASTDITEVTLAALTTAHTDGGFLFVNDGTYRLDLPDAAFATGANYVDFGGTVTGMVVFGGRVRLVDYSLEVANLAANVITVEGTDATDVLGTAQTGDAFARLGPPAGASHAADVAAVKSDTATTLVDTADMQPKLGTFSDLGSGATLAGNLEDMRDNGTAVFDRATDSQQAIRDRGDAAWTTGGAGSDPSIQSTTVATVTSQTILVPTATPTFVDQINGWAVYLEDASDADAYHLTIVTNYDQANGQVTIAEAAPFTVAASDTMVFLPAFMDLGVDVTAWNGTTLATTNPLPNAAPGGNGGLPTVDASNRVTALLSSGTGTGQLSISSGLLAWNPAWDAEVESESIDALVTQHLNRLFAADYDPASKPGVATALLNELVESDAGVSQFTANALEDAPSGTGASAVAIADEVQTRTIAAVTTVTNLTNSPTSGDLTATMKTSVQTAATASLNAYDPPTRAEATSDANSILTAVGDVPTNAELTAALAAQLASQRIITGTCSSGSTTTCVDAALTQTTEAQLDDRLMCFDDSWCAMITGFTPGSDTVTTTKVAPSTRAAKAYTIFPATLE